MRRSPATSLKRPQTPCWARGRRASSSICGTTAAARASVRASTDIADYLLPDGKTIVSFKGKGVDDSVKITEDGHQVDVPIILLVNGESASASEVLTGALKDNGWATVVGTKTFGKGIAQGIFDLPDGSALKASQRRIITFPPANASMRWALSRIFLWSWTKAWRA